MPEAARPTLPAWVPPAVVATAEMLGYGDDVSMRLLTDRRMQRVWTVLFSEKPKADALETLEDWQQPIDAAGFGPNERASAALYAICAREMRENFTATKAQVASTAKEWRHIAQTCRSVWSVDYAPLREPVLAAALERSAEHFDDLANWLETRTGPRLLGKGYGKSAKHDEATRARVASFIFEADRVFETELRTPLATMSSVALASDITPQEIDNWRALMKS